MFFEIKEFTHVPFKDSRAILNPPILANKSINENDIHYYSHTSDGVK